MVVERARSKRRIEIPYENGSPDSRDPEFEEAEAAMAGTTSLGREIVRKIVFRARRRIYGDLRPAQPAATPEAQPASPGGVTPAVDSPSEASPALATTAKAPPPKPELDPVPAPAPSVPLAPVPAPPIESAPASPAAQASLANTVVMADAGWNPVRGCSIEEARRLGLVKRR